jgi:hypothetical protein
VSLISLYINLSVYDMVEKGETTCEELAVDKLTCTEVYIASTQTPSFFHLREAGLGTVPHAMH